ncbi:MAG TPA: cystathionine gamma-synthase, partial [Thermoanaerobaculia bacterium]|nr:cystathionine gamma-synthase [Thermoanaerobaculia bacterium]
MPFSSDDAEIDPTLATLALHAGTTPDPATGAILTPIYQSTTYV